MPKLENFTKKRYRELLALETEGLLESSTKYELRSYDDIFNAQITWEMRDQYLSLLESFCSNEIGPVELWLDLGTLNASASQMLQIARTREFILSPYVKCIAFISHIEEMTIECQDYVTNLQDEVIEKEKIPEYKLEFKNHMANQISIAKALILDTDLI